MIRDDQVSLGRFPHSLDCGPRSEFIEHSPSSVGLITAMSVTTRLTCTISAQSAKPLPLTPKNFFRWAAWLLVLAIAVFTLPPIELRPVTTAPADLEWFVAFAEIGAAFCFGYPQHRLYILVLLIGILGFLEIAQNYVPGRHGRFPDGTVKASDALLGAAFAAIVTRHKRVP